MSHRFQGGPCEEKKRGLSVIAFLRARGIVLVFSTSLGHGWAAAAYKRQMIVSGDVFYVTFPALAGVSYSVYYIPTTSSGILRETNVIAHG